MQSPLPPSPCTLACILLAGRGTNARGDSCSFCVCIYSLTPLFVCVLLCVCSVTAEQAFRTPDFCVGTNKAEVVWMKSYMFEEIEAEVRAVDGEEKREVFCEEEEESWDVQGGGRGNRGCYTKIE